MPATPSSEADFDNRTNSGLFLDGSLIVQEGDVFDGFVVPDMGCGTVNNLGDIVFDCGIDTANGRINAIIKRPSGDTNGENSTIVAKGGDTIGGKLLNGVYMPSINDSGQIVFTAFYTEDGTSKKGLFTPTEVLVESGEVIDGKTVVRMESSNNTLNDGGITVQNVRYNDANGQGTGLLLVDLATKAKSWLVTKGDLLDGVEIDQFRDSVAVNDPDTVIFAARGTDNELHFMAYNWGTESGYHLLGPGGKFFSIIEFGLNDAGEVKFRGVSGAPYPYDNAFYTLPEVTHENGDVVDGLMLTGFLHPSLNDLGGLAYLGLADGLRYLFLDDKVLASPGDLVAGKTLSYISGGSLNNLGDILFESEYVEDGVEKYGIFLIEGPDVDADGVSDTVEDNAPNDGDGVKDSEQINVASLPNSEDQQFVSVASPDGTVLEDVVATENPSPTDTPTDADFPVGFLDFNVNGIGAGGSTTVEIFIPEGTVVNKYLKYGPEPGNPTPHWYSFSYNGTTGAEFFADRIVLHFVDGLRGDDDLAANGIIVDPGAPSFVPPSDLDGDGVDDIDDLCPNSDMRDTIYIGAENTGVANEPLGDGCTLADLIAKTLAGQEAGVSDTVELLVQWKGDGLISGKEMGRLLKQINND